MQLFMGKGAFRDDPQSRGSAQMRPGSGGTPGNALQRYYAVALEPQTYLNLAYMVAGLGLGVAYFVALVTVLAVGGGLAITLVGLPLLIAAMYGWCVLAGFERVQTNVLLGAAIPPLAFKPGNREYWRWSRIKSRLGDPLTWRSLAWLFVRFPHGIATFTIAAVLFLWPLQMVAMPLLAPLDAGYNFYFWKVDTVWEGALFMLPGLLLWPLSLRLMNVLAYASGRLARVALMSPTLSGDTASRVDEVASNAFAWRGISFNAAPAPRYARIQAVQLRIFAVHAAVFLGLSVILVIINWSTTPDVSWAIWPIWGLGIVFAGHTGYFARGFLGLHILLFAIVNLGLFVIDATYSGGQWFFYPLIAWGALLLVHAFGAQRIGTAAVERAHLGEPAVLAPVSAGPEPPAETPLSEAQPALGPISVDVAMRIVTVGGERVEVTPKEFDLLALFVQNPGRPFTRDDLLERIWKNDYEVTDRTIDTHVQRLRKKLGAQSEAIETVWGVGYRFQA